ncbi:hypothetical protein GMDG_06210 [Pseudogymnoascus destructans 20631-21]|uniref:Uncharacterized protein n=1 Tax=Pseudogymnoascus destructans (strain ATCC MYA-4855 / 20631-21) TaxID=658429 RepID=L8FR71_PSED2|nr:hypothetical protein GMDG_06210 [Pseudogymnoascus destructans 20631-21]
MPPPPIPAATEHASILGEDDSELVQHNRSSQPFSPYLAFMAMWAEKYNLSRQAYQGLNEGLPLGQDLNIKAVELPRDVTTLKKQFMAQLPLLPLQHKMVDLNQEKLPTMTPAEKTGPRKDRQADAHWFDVAMLVTAILSAEDLHKDFWKGLGANIGSESPVPLTRLEKLLSEDDFEFVLPEDLVQQPDITVDYTFGNGILGQQDHGFKPQSQIRRVLNTMHEEIRPAAQSHPHVAELELKAYGREWIVKALKQGFISVPWLMFIDGFGLYRNMYRSMTGYLVVLAFASIAKSNATTCAWRMNPGQHQDAEKAIFEGRSMYRGLCNAASLASQMKVRNQGKGKGKGKGHASLTPSVTPPSVDTAT